MLPPPPRSTLFPYTTLFRSGQAGRIFTRPALRLIHRHSGGVPRLINMIAHRAMVAAFAEDRKSTRLNSSHVEISYAVFCLKKKKKEVLMHVAVVDGVTSEDG